MNEISNEQSSAASKQPESGEIMDASIYNGASSASIQALQQCFARSSKMQRLSEELQKFTQTLSNEESSPAGVNELLHTFVKQKKYGSRIDERTIKLQNYRHKSNFTKRGHT